MVFRWAIMGVLLCCRASLCQDYSERLPDDTRLILRVNAKAVNDAALIKKHNERLRTLFADGLAVFANLGIEPGSVEAVWFTLGSSFPQGTSIIVVGKLDSAKFEQKMQQHVRDRRFAARAFRAEDCDCFAVETPVGLNPIPGLPASLYLALKKDALNIAFDQPTLQTLLRSGGDKKTVRDRFADCQNVLNADSAMVGGCVPPEAMTVASAYLAGIKSIHLEVDLSDTLNARAIFRNGGRESFPGQMAAGLNQAKQLLAATRAQQTGDFRLAQFLVELLDAAKTELEGNDLVLSTELKADVIARLLKK